MGSVLVNKSAKSPQGAGKRGRKRKNETPTALLKRVRDEEKENNYVMVTRRKSASSTPPAATPESPRKSPRKLKSSPYKGALVRVDEEENQRNKNVEQRIHLRKPRLVRKWNDILEMRNSVKGYTPGELLDKWIGNVARGHHGIFLSRNMKKSYLTNKDIRSPWGTSFGYYEKFIDYDLLNMMRVQACSISGERPFFAVEFEKINDWAETIENDNIDRINSTSHITWSIAIVDSHNRVRIFPGGFALVPLFKQVEENLGKLLLSKLTSVKSRSFTCPENVLKNAREMYIVVEAKRFVRKDIHEIISGGKRRRITVINTTSVANGICNTDYVTMRRFGARRLYSVDLKREIESFVEGVTHIVLVEQKFNGINFDNDNWMNKLENLQLLELENSTHGNSYLPRLVLSPVDDRIPKDVTFPKIRRSPARLKIGNDVKIMYSLHDTISEAGSVAYNRCLQEFENMKVGIPYQNPKHFLAYMAARFPCFRMDISPQSCDSNCINVYISPEGDFFNANAEINLFQPFSHFSPRVWCSVLSRRRYSQGSELGEAALAQEREWEAAIESELPDMPISYLPCTRLQWVTRNMTKMALKDDSEIVEEREQPNSQKEVAKKKIGDKKKKKGEAKNPRSEKVVSENEPMNELQVTVRVPKENSRFISEDFIRSDSDNLILRKPSENVVTERQGQKVINHQIEEKKIEAYRERQRKAYSKLLGEMKRPKKKNAWLGMPPGTRLLNSDEVLDVCTERKDAAEDDVEDEKNRKEEGINGGVELDIEGNTIQVPGTIEFEPGKLTLYNILFREFLANEGHRFGSHGSKRKANLISGFLETCHMPLFEHELEHIYLKQLELLELTSSIESSAYIEIYMRFVALSNEFASK